ncbi:MAG: N,N'-diacetylchitobiose phosphorylase [Candidatus Methylacidiphilales bacterium]
MKYGYFDDAAKEYVITRPDTPRAWSNYLGSRIYGGIITNQAGGYSFTRSPAEGRILRHRYNSVPMDMPGRPFYLRDVESGDFWTAAWQPVGKPLDQYRTETRFGPGYAVITSVYGEIETETTYFIPLEANFEVWWLRLKNQSPRARSLDVFSFCEFTTEWNLVNDLLNLQYAQYIAEAVWRDGFIEASSCGRLPEDPENFANRDQARRWWMTQVGGQIRGYDGDREKFLGPYGGFSAPDAVRDGACRNSHGSSDNICGAVCSRVELAPGETSDVLVLLGIGTGQKEGRAALDRAGTPERAAEVLAGVKQYWHRLLDVCTVKTPDPDFDHMTNVWGAYNALMTFEWSRSCSLVYTGDQRDGYGFRDTVQDMLGVTHLLPEMVRDRLILMLSGQDATGGAQPEIRPWAHRPGAMPPTPASHYRSDDCLWFFNVIPLYVAETGDVAFYDQVVPYADTGEATVLGHLRRALEFNLERTGANGLPCGLLADWNDCLKLGYRGESVFVAFQLRLGLKTYAEIAGHLGRDAEAEWARKELDRLDQAIARVCWDGEWFIWAIAEDGTVFGTKHYPEGQVYLNTQCWAVLSGAASPEQTEMALNTVRDRLASEFGVALCTPPFEETPVTVMRAVLFNPGNKENGGIFSHTQSWAVLAEIARGQGDQAYAYYRAFMPAAQNEIADRREIEPYVHCQSTHAKPSPKYGASRVPWLSGTASWSHYTALSGILGLKPAPDGFRIDPCIPSSWPGFEAVRMFRGKRLRIRVTNPERKCSGIRSLVVNGQRMEGNWIAMDRLGEDNLIEASIGS